MTENKRNEYRALLEAKEAELGASLRSRERIAVEKAADEIDEMVLAQERDFAIRGMDRGAALLREVRAALDRLADRTYGICLECDEEIGTNRMAAVPWAAYCRACQEKIDANGRHPTNTINKHPQPTAPVRAGSRRALSDAA